MRRIAGFVAILFLLTGSTTSVAWACACGCSVFDVGGLGAPQEDDRGGRIFTEWWYANQNQNWIGSSKGPASANNDKQVLTNWFSVGFQYMFSREWGVMVRGVYANRSFTTQDPSTLMLNTFHSSDFGDTEIMGMYTGFSHDMSTGVIFGLSLPSGPYTAPGFDRDTQIGSGTTGLILGAFHRGLITGDNAWQYFAQVRALIPFLFRPAINPDTGLNELYKPGYQIDGAAGVVYNNGYNILGFDKIAPLLQIIGSHRVRDSGEAADPLNSGFDRLMISPGIEFTKVLDEANKRVGKLYVDVEIPIYYRVNAGFNPDNGNKGQLISPVLTKVIGSYNF
jgi:hypothetical protein